MAKTLINGLAGETMNNILITSAGRRVELVESFIAEARTYESGIQVLCVDLLPHLSPACQIADAHFAAPQASSCDYIEFLKNLCIDQSIRLIVPTIDTELSILSEHREDFLQLGVYVAVSSMDLVAACRNKNYTSDLLNEIGIETPAIYAKHDIQFPCFVKPYDGSSSVGAFPLFHESMLTPDLLQNDKNMFMEFVPQTYDEYTVDAYYDKEGELKCLVPRLRISTRSGEVSKGLTRKGAVYDYLSPKLRKLQGAEVV